MKKPVLVLGVVLFALFLSQDTTKKWWANYGHRFIPNTCMSLKERIDDQSPDSWEIQCPGTEKLVLTIESDLPSPLGRELRQSLYRMLANTYVQFSKISNHETLELLKQLHIIVKHSKLTIHSQTRGKDVIRFASLKSQKDIALHLKGSVRVREISN